MMIDFFIIKSIHQLIFCAYRVRTPNILFKIRVLRVELTRIHNIIPSNYFGYSSKALSVKALLAHHPNILDQMVQFTI